jgi:exopolyphosphatase/guanosine-5'-triphosphate,3'-diphosphate pyrophosphatase
MRVAAIDIGTNTVLLLVADRETNGELVAVAERATVTRLGQNVDKTRRLAPEAIARTAACLDDYARIVRELGATRVGVVATSAMRDAAGGESLQERVRSLFGVDARILTGGEEAGMAFRGSVAGLKDLEGPHVAIFDIGGGSTEVVLGRLTDGVAEIAFASSFDLGSVRLTERLVSRDPIAPGELDAVLEAARTGFANVPELGLATTPIGTAGTMTTLAAVSLKLDPYDGARVHGHVLDVEELRAVVARLAGMTAEARRKLPGMEPKRADVIVAGGCIAMALLDHWGAARVRISDRGVRWGLAQEIAGTANTARREN